MVQRGADLGASAHPLGRRAAIALAFVPVAAAVAIAAAAAWHGPAPAMEHACIDYTVPLHPGYEEEIRAIIARGDEPGRIGGGSGYLDYFRNATRATHFYTDTKSVAYRLPPVPEYVDSQTAPMAVATALNLYAAPPGPCVWEHEYIACGGSLENLEYDRRLRCYLADEPAGAPAPPYELADEETRALLDRAGPPPGHAGGDFRYLERNTRAGMLAGADFGSPDRTVRDALEHTGGNVYRAAKMINRESPAGAGCVMEYVWIAGGGSLSSLDYSDARRCYLAPAGAASGDSGAHCLGRWQP